MREALAQEVDAITRLSLTQFGARSLRIRMGPKYLMSLCNALMIMTNAICAAPWEAKVRDKNSTATIVLQVGLEVEMLQSFYTASAAMVALTSMSSHPGWLSLNPTRIHPDYRQYCIDQAYRVQNWNFLTNVDAPAEYPNPVFGRQDWREPPRAEYHPINDPNSKLHNEEHDTGSYENEALYAFNEEYSMELLPKV